MIFHLPNGAARDTLFSKVRPRSSDDVKLMSLVVFMVFLYSVMHWVSLQVLSHVHVHNVGCCNSSPLARGLPNKTFSRQMHHPVG